MIDSTGNRTAPEWTERQTYEDGSKTNFVGSAVTEGGTSSHCFIIADQKALSELGRSLENAFLDQSSVIESSDEPSARRVISSLRNERPRVEGFQIVDRFYSRVQVRSESYDKTEMRCFSLASAPTARVQAAVQALARKLRGDSSDADQSLKEIAEAQRKAAQ